MLSIIQENESLLLILGIVSLVSFVLTLAVIPWVLINHPSNYFAKPRRISLIPRDTNPSVRVILLLVKNILGVAIVLLGVIMLVIPGQGLLTILIGLTLTDFPKKYRMQRWLISRKPVLSSANWLRRKGGRKPLTIGKI